MRNRERSALVERSDGFNYGYAMNCTCGSVSVLSAEDYYAEANGAHMKCAHCGTSIHFGVAVAALRDQDDPALDDEAVARFAWYHTSTEPEWPSSDYARRFIQDMEQNDHRPVNRDHYVSMQTTKALHLGTYETAVENMLRRMHDEHDGGSQFYLYRVAIELRPGRINPGYRDENHDDAAQLSISELDRDSLDAVRYLNVHEGTGVLSLAIRPEVVTAVQRMPIPLPELALPPIPGFLDREITALAHARDEMEAAQARVESIPHGRRRMMYFGAYDDPDGLAKKAGYLEHRYIDLWNQLEDQLAEAYLPSASRPIRRDLNEAMGSWKSANPTADPQAFISRYRAMAALIEKSPEVISALAHQPWRDLRSF